MNRFRFLKWDVYQDAQKLFRIILEIVRKLPREYRFDIGSQIIRAAFSVVLNIAEGSGKGTDRDFSRFLDIALGSLYEVLSSADTLRNCGLISQEEFMNVLDMCERISDQLGGFKKKLRSS